MKQKILRFLGLVLIGKCAWDTVADIKTDAGVGMAVIDVAAVLSVALAVYRWWPKPKVIEPEVDENN